MDNIFVYIIVVIVLLILALWGVALLPLPGAPYFVRGLLMFLCVAVAGFAIARKARVL